MCARSHPRYGRQRVAVWWGVWQSWAMVARRVVQGDGVAWLRARARGEEALGAEHAVVTSLPDVSELEGTSLEGWRAWFVETVTLVGEALHPQGVAIFYQTDIKRDGCWIDKGHLVTTGAEAAGLGCLWHKIVCRTEPGGTTFGRPAYGHWLAFSRELRLEPGASTPDVVPGLGMMTWSRAMPMTAAVGSCRFLKEHSRCEVVVDPFCGRGTMLAVANHFGLAAIGVELSKKRARKARGLQLTEEEIASGRATR